MFERIPLYIQCMGEGLIVEEKIHVIFDLGFWISVYDGYIFWKSINDEYEAYYYKLILINLSIVYTGKQHNYLGSIYIYIGIYVYLCIFFFTNIIFKL